MTDTEWSIEREHHMRRIKSTAEAHQLACLNADYTAEFFTSKDYHSADTYDMFIYMMKQALKAGHNDAVLQAIKNL